MSFESNLTCGREPNPTASTRWWSLSCVTSSRAASAPRAARGKLAGHSQRSSAHTAPPTILTRPRPSQVHRAGAAGPPLLPGAAGGPRGAGGGGGEVGGGGAGRQRPQGGAEAAAADGPQQEAARQVQGPRRHRDRLSALQGRPRGGGPGDGERPRPPLVTSSHHHGWICSVYSWFFSLDSGGQLFDW